MREVRIRPRAQLDLESIFVHIAVTLGSPMAAQGILDELFDSFERAAEMPTLGMAFSSEDLARDYRRILVKNYWVYYDFDDERLTVWRIFHTRQDIDTYTLVGL